MTLKGISQEEIFILDRNIGNQDSGFSAQNTFLEVVKVLNKAVKHDNSLEDIALHLNLQATTMLYRHLYIFENLNKKLHKFVRYGSSKDYINDKEGNFVAFQMANELSRVPIEFQENVYKFIKKNKLKGWNEIKSVRELIERTDLDLNQIFEKVLNESGKSSTNYSLVFELKLEELSPKVFNLPQEEKNKVAKKIISQYINEPVYEVNLAYTILEIVTNERLKFTSKELKDFKKSILDDLRDFK